MPLYNTENYVADAIDSVIAQTYQNWELLITDDCSTDGSIAIVESYMLKDNRIRLFILEKNSGAAVARNKCLREAQGRYIAFLDSDDVWNPHKLEHQVQFMKNNGYSFSYHEYNVIDEHSNEIGLYVSGKKHVGKYDMYSCCWPGCLTVMYDKNVVGLVQIEDIPKNNDTAIWFKVVEKADCYLLKENLAYYRHREGSITPTSVYQKIRWHYILYRNALDMNSFVAVVWTMISVYVNLVKKVFYTYRYRN